MSNLVPFTALLVLLLMSFKLGQALRCHAKEFDGSDGPDDKECPEEADSCYAVKCGDIQVKGCAKPPEGPEVACEKIDEACKKHGDPNPYCHFCEGDHCNHADGDDDNDE